MDRGTSNKGTKSGLGFVQADPFEFHLFNHVACLTIGFWGCVLFQRRWGLSPSAFFFFAVSFNFYGGFALKIAAYGPSMMGYYLSIFVILLLTDIHESKKEKNKAVFSRNAVWLAICLSTIMYLGSLHYFVQWVTFICFWSFFNRSSLIEIIKAGFLTFLLKIYKIVLKPYFQLLGGIKNEFSEYFCIEQTQND